MTGKNNITSKQFNRGLLLKLIATKVCRTRIELSKATGLTKMTVTNIISEFMQQDLVAECEEEQTEVCGRNPGDLAESAEGDRAFDFPRPHRGCAVHHLHGDAGNGEHSV